eukprot:252565_1
MANAALQQTLQSEIIAYLSALDFAELKSVTRHKCRLYLEKKLNQNLNEYKKYIKSVLINQYNILKQQYSQEPKPLQPLTNHPSNITNIEIPTKYEQPPHPILPCKRKSVETTNNNNLPSKRRKISNKNNVKSEIDNNNNNNNIENIQINDTNNILIKQHVENSNNNNSESIQINDTNNILIKQHIKNNNNIESIESIQINDKNNILIKEHVENNNNNNSESIQINDTNNILIKQHIKNNNNIESIESIQINDKNNILIKEHVENNNNNNSES